MYRIEYFPRVRDDLQDIQSYLDKIDRRLTDKIFKAFRERIQGLEEMPSRHPKYMYRPEYRVLGIHNYLIFYVVAEETKTVEIRRILHGARNIEHEITKEDIDE